MRKYFRGFLALSLLAAIMPGDLRAEPIGESTKLRAKYLLTVTDDFIVDAYHNGEKIPDSARQLLEEIHGATVERINIPVREGDWLVFHIVNNRLRWSGKSYFAVAGLTGPYKREFVSSPNSSFWSCCDTPEDSSKFIAIRNYMSERRPSRIANPWSDGDALMKKYAGKTWNGSPLWGKERDTWIKVAIQ